MGILNMLSPGIQVNEVDLTTIVPGTSVSVGAYVGEFNWGPCDEPMLINDENQLLAMFGTPTVESSDSFVATSFFSCANFLSYTNSLYVVRSINAAGNNCTNARNTANNVLVRNSENYENVYLYANNQSQFGDFVARYPGKIGNSLKISVCSDAQKFNDWEYSEYFDNAPGTSNYVLEKTGKDLKDELHIVVVDTLGKFTGKANTVIEKFPFVSKAKDATGADGLSGYYKNVLFQNSNYILALDPPDYANTNTSWGKESSDIVSSYAAVNNLNITLSNGTDGEAVLASNLISNWSSFLDKDRYEISLAFVGASSDLEDGITVPQYVLDTVILGANSETPTSGRKDTMLFVSPRLSDVKQVKGYEISNVTGATGFLAAFNRSSSYCVADSGWKYQYDRYNNIYRWVPLNADIAGLCAYTDNVADTWYSPAGFTRGKIKNVVKLAWSPNQTERDALYKRGVNPVVTVTGEGTVLLGDKTLQAKPSAFDRINVRRLFIILEKAISRFARYSMFEFNDAFTRAQFVAAVEPYLRTVQGRRGITDFKVVCDETNNTGDIVDRNAFVGDIYIKPARSINFIQLNFVATKTGVEFGTVIGQF